MRLPLLVPSSFILAIHLGAADTTTKKTLITYNAGLYVTVGRGIIPDPPSRETRRDAIINELKSPTNDADVVCLQEVYVGEDVDKITEELAAIYPYSFSQLHDSSGSVPMNGLDTTPPCGDGMVQSIAFPLFVSCYENNCFNAHTVDECMTCVAEKCVLQYAALSEECMACILTEGTIAGVKDKCSQPVSQSPMRYRNMNRPSLLILSKTNMSNTAWVEYHPHSTEYLGQYSYLEAQIADIGQVVCTHVAAPATDLGLYPEVQIRLVEGINSYVEQNAAELGKLVTTFASTSPVFLLGDFNVGDAEVKENYKIMTSAFQTQSHDECTFCDAPENAYNGETSRLVIDHIFYNGVTYIEGSSKRVFDDVSVDGYPLSDHFGVKQTFNMPTNRVEL